MKTVFKQGTFSIRIGMFELFDTLWSSIDNGLDKWLDWLACMITHVPQLLSNSIAYLHFGTNQKTMELHRGILL